MQHSYYLPLKRALRDARKHAGARQSDIADKSGLSMPTVGLLEQGKGTLDSLDAYLDCLNLDIYGDALPQLEHRGRRIRELRKARGISQAALAEKIGITVKPIVKIEKHWRGRVETLDTILLLLGAGAYLAPSGLRSQSQTAANPEYRSAAGVMETLHEVFGSFDLSPCPSEISGRDLPVQADNEYTADSDPLRLPWRGRIFVNPPFNDELPLWVEKAYDAYQGGKAPLVAAYLPVFTNRPWWYQFVANKALVVCLRGVVTVKNGEANELPESIVIWGADDAILDKIEQAYPESWVIRPKE